MISTMHQLAGAGFGWIVLASAALAMLLAIGLMGLTAFRFRVPAGAWAAGPCGVALVGLAGCLVSCVQAHDAMANPDWLSLDLRILSLGYGREALARQFEAFALAGWCAVLGSLALGVGTAAGARSPAPAEPRYRFTWAPLLFGAAATAGGTIATAAVFAAVGPDHVGLYGLSFVLVALAVGAAQVLASVRIGTEADDVERILGARATVAVLSLLALAMFAWAHGCEMNALALKWAVSDSYADRTTMLYAVTGEWSAGLAMPIAPAALAALTGFIAVATAATVPEHAGRAILGGGSMAGALVVLLGGLAVAETARSPLKNAGIAPEVLDALLAVDDAPEGFQNELFHADCARVASQGRFVPIGSNTCDDPLLITTSQMPMSAFAEVAAGRNGPLRLSNRRSGPKDPPGWLVAATLEVTTLDVRTGPAPAAADLGPDQTLIVAEPGGVQLLDRNGGVHASDAPTTVAEQYRAEIGSELLVVASPDWSVQHTLDWCQAPYPLRCTVYVRP